MRRPGVAWIALSALLGACALGGWWLAPVAALDWQPALVGHEPWRSWSAVGVHYSAAHLHGNLGGLALTGLLGWAARVPTRIALAWLAAWPLTQLGLLLEPTLLHYGGLSGVLHAGVAATVVFLLRTGNPRQRTVGAIVAVGLLAKVLGEAPWGEPLRRSAHLDIAVAPFAHATGTLAGATCAMIALLLAPARHD